MKFYLLVVDADMSKCIPNAVHSSAIISVKQSVGFIKRSVTLCYGRHGGRTQKDILKL